MWKCKIKRNVSLWLRLIVFLFFSVEERSRILACDRKTSWEVITGHDLRYFDNITQIVIGSVFPVHIQGALINRYAVTVYMGMELRTEGKLLSIHLFN